MSVPNTTSTVSADGAVPAFELEEITCAVADGHLLPGDSTVETRETHASRVFLTTSDVYKLKKPVNLGFLDYSTPRRRGRMCRQEVALNRRLAPDVYLGVERVTRERDATLKLNGRGRVVDYLVHMRRLSDRRSLDSLLRSGAATRDDIRSVGALIGTFHRRAEPAPLQFGSRTFRRNARENLRQLQALWPASLPRRTLGALDAYFDDALKRSWSAIEERVAAGRVRDGHGDLRMEHIYLEDRIQVIDCVEFNARYRASDTALDLAFLVMDLAASGYPDMVEALVAGYESAAADAVAAVLPLYSWYRALVRAKVAAILESESDAPDGTRAAARLDARRNLHHAVRLVGKDSRPLLLAVSGLPGTGKSTLARALAVATGSTVNSADETRKRLAGLGPGVHPPQALDSGLYGDEMNRYVYHTLVKEAGVALRLGRGSILDATFRRRDDRMAIRDLATRFGARFMLIRCETPEDVSIERLRRRAITPDTWSDATVDTYQAHRERSEDDSDLPPAEYIPVTTIIPLIEQVDMVLSRLWA